MSLDSELNRVFSEALPPRRPTDNPEKAQRFAARKDPNIINYGEMLKPSSPQQRANPQPKGSDFASIRKSMRRPMVNLDAQVHNIDHMLNVTQKDPSQLGSTVGQIEKSFEGIVDPLKQVRTGVQGLRKAANEFGAEYVGTKDELEAERAGINADADKYWAKKQMKGVKRTPETPDEDQFMNRVVTDVEQMTSQQDKLNAITKGYEQYRKTGGKMNRGEFVRSAIKKIQAAKSTLPPEEEAKKYGEEGKRPGAAQFLKSRTSPMESSAQRRKIISR